MYCFCHNLHHSSAPDDHSQKLEGPPPHECRGIWFYHCFCHFHPPPHNLSGGDHSQQRTTHMPQPETYLNTKSTHRVYCKDKTDHSLSICEGKVILAPTNPSDPHQQWIKVEKFGTDEEGYSFFALINKATGEALNHAIGVKYPVKLKEYNPNVVEKSVLWSMGRNLGDGYRAVRAADNIHFNLTAHNTDLYATDIVFWKWDSTDNQMWTIASYCKFLC
ncbi:putative ricin B-like lectin [Helianthus annuus]|nr:putative ricin B-like lectin [Helianthus annuus]